MLMMRDPDHVVRVPLRVLSKKVNLDPDKEKAYQMVEDAIKVLLSPDGRSHEYQEFEGRRITRVDDGWAIINGEKYLQQMRGLAARVRKTQLQRERRALKKSPPIVMPDDHEPQWMSQAKEEEWQKKLKEATGSDPI